MSSVKKILTSFPIISENLYIGGIVGVRPYRKGGLRIQKQLLFGKTIVHNYGHGGAGISLAPATAEQAVSLCFKQITPKTENVAILGSGIVGLFTALEAAQLGLKTVVYAKRIPQPKCIDSHKMCTSQVPPGYWLPYSYQYNNQNIHQQRSLRSFKKYLKLSAQFQSISLTDVYEPQNFQKSNLPQFIKKNSNYTTIELGNLKQKMLHFKSLQINLRQFLQDLINLCMKKGVQFYEKQLTSQSDIQKIPQKYIINCLGLGSKYVFNDTLMYGKKGYLLSYKNQSKQKWGIYGFDYENCKLKFYILPDRILIGLTSEQSENLDVNAGKVAQLKQRTYHFLALCGLGNHPKL